MKPGENEIHTRKNDQKRIIFLLWFENGWQNNWLHSYCCIRVEYSTIILCFVRMGPIDLGGSDRVGYVVCTSAHLYIPILIDRTTNFFLSTVILLIVTIFWLHGLKKVSKSNTEKSGTFHWFLLSFYLFENRKIWPTWYPI